MPKYKEVFVGIESTAKLVRQLVKTLDEIESHGDMFLPSTSSSEDVSWKDIKKELHMSLKLLKEKVDKQVEDESAFEEMKSETWEYLAEREVLIAEKEKALMDRLHEVKDNAVSAVMEAQKIYPVASVVPFDISDIKGGKFDASLPDNKSGEFGEAVNPKLTNSHELEQLCEQMDAKGLLEFITEKGGHITASPEELSVALKCAPDPACLVLDILEGFCPPDSTYLIGGKNCKARNVWRRASLALLRSAAPVLAGHPPGCDSMLSSKIKQQAKRMADMWKAKLAKGSPMEREAFVQLLATFGIASEFEDKDELGKLQLAVSNSKKAAELCQSQCLVQKIPGVIGALIGSGRQIAAVHFVHAFHLTKRFPPVYLLKSYLKAARKKTLEKTQNRKAGVLRDASDEELAALQEIIQCIRQYKLQNKYPLGPLQQRIAQLKNTKKNKLKLSQNQAKRLRVEKTELRRPAIPAGNWRLQNGMGVYAHAPTYSPYFFRRASASYHHQNSMFPNC